MVARGGNLVFRRDPQLALRLADWASAMPGESTECVDFHPRALEAVYGLLSLEFPEACVENGSDENNWLFLALNGYEIFPWPIDTGYGRPHFLRAPMVSKVASNLVHVNHEALGDASAVFQRLRDFFCAASAAHHAVLMTPLS